jgi:hypothetical protein
MSITIRFDKGKPLASAELMIKSPPPGYELGTTEAPEPRDLDSTLASQGFRHLLDEVRSLLERELEGSGLEMVQLTGAAFHDVKVYRPGICFTLREGEVTEGMSEPSRERVTDIAETIRECLKLP